MYIAIDGDDVGRKITSSYLSNSEERLTYISNKLNDTTKKISKMLLSNGFEIISKPQMVLQRKQTTRSILTLFLIR